MERDLEYSRTQITVANYFTGGIDCGGWAVGGGGRGVVVGGEREAQRQHQEYVRQMTDAKSRAHKRLLDSMTDQQISDYTRHGYFDVMGSEGHLYRLRKDGHIGNIVMPVSEQWGLRPDLVGTPFNGPHFCMHLYNGVDTYPDDDHLLAQALMIRTDEVAFRRIACNLS